MNNVDVDIRVKLNRELKELANIVGKGKIRIEAIQKELETLQVKKLSITKHAIERYKTRISDLPTQIIKKLLWDSNLLEKYLKNGPGRHRMNNKPGVIAVIKDHTILTIIDEKSPSYKLEYLPAYMDYWIEERCKEEWNGNVLSFRQFIKKLYE